jgi:TPR repeat protein
MKLFKMASDKGSPPAMLNLAVEMGRGANVAKQIATALKLMKASADLGEPLAQFNYGLMTYYGLGLAVDHVAALKYFILAQAGGVFTAHQFAGELQREKAG